MNIFSYIDKYGVYSFDELEFNDVDNLIFSSLSYVDLGDYVSANRFNKKTISSVGKAFFEKFDSKSKNIIATKTGIKVLENIMNTRRFSSLMLYNYSYIGDDKQQFSAITIDINSKLSYVSYEGTDHLISGWHEDFMMAYEFPVLSQRRAIDYLNRHFLFNNRDIILGGHSKGGNLAMVAGMYANFWVKDRIIKIYSNDGPGLRKKEISSKYYLSVKEKLVHIIPNYSIVGLVLRHDDNYFVVRSYKKSIYSHSLDTWVVQDNKLEQAPLSSFSKIFDESMINWLDMYSDEERRMFVDALFLIFEQAGIVSLKDILNNKKIIFKLIMKSNQFDKKTKSMIRDFLYVFFSCFKEIKSQELLGRSNK